MAVKGPNTVKSIVAGLHGTHDPARQSKQGAIQSMVTGHNDYKCAYTCVHVRTCAYNQVNYIYITFKKQNTHRGKVSCLRCHCLQMPGKFSPCTDSQIPFLSCTLIFVCSYSGLL